MRHVTFFVICFFLVSSDMRPATLATRGKMLTPSTFILVGSRPDTWNGFFSVISIWKDFLVLTELYRDR